MTWPQVAFGEVFEIQLGKMLDKNKNVGALRPYLANRDVQWGRCNVSNLGQMRFTDADREKFALRPGDLLVCEGGEVGRTAIWEGQVADCYYQKAIHRLRARADIEPRFILHYMRWAVERRLFAQVTNATSIAHLTAEKLKLQTLPMLPLSEQKRLAKILDAAEDLGTKRRQALKDLEALLQSVFIAMFGDPVTNPKKWKLGPIGDLLESVTYGTSKKANPEKGAYPILRMNNITYAGGWDFSEIKYVDLSSDEARKHLVHKGHLLFNRTNSKQLVGKTAVYRRDEPMAYAGYLVRGIVNSQASPEYIGAFMNTPQMKTFLQSKCKNIIGMANINAKEFAAIPIPQPPVALQHRFARIKEAVEKQKEMQEAHLVELDALFESLQARAFGGSSDQMKVSANFAFLEKEFPHVAEGASFAEQYVFSNPRAACFHARHALERLVKRMFKIERNLKPPADESLVGYLSDATFRSLVPEVVWQKADYIRQLGNVAVHGKNAPPAEKALAVVNELAHVLYWAGRTYLRKGAETLKGKVYDESLIPKAAGKIKPQSVDALEALREKWEKAEASRKEVESEIEKLRTKLAAIKAENQAVPETHNWSEDETRTRLIDLALQRAGWKLDGENDVEYPLAGMPNKKGIGLADYVLWGDDGKPLGVIEAKKTMVNPEVGQQQAKLYADCLEKMHGQRPIIFFTNGYRTVIWDDLAYPPREVAGFYKKEELAALIHRRSQRTKLDVARVNNAIVERFYQKRAIGSIATQFTKSHRKALLVMATGTGKTRTAIALIELLQRAGWIKRALFLADRVSLVNQTVSAFKAHLPESSPVNLVTEKDKTGRVYVCTYPTMMALIDETEGAHARFSVGHFDLVVIDEAHQSVYQRYGAIFRYFDALLVGLTATPREQIDKNTYSLFGLETGEPTDAYELKDAVKDGFLVPPRVLQVDLKFPREGIDYDALSDEEKDQWESLDWGDNGGDDELPDKVSSSAINSWLFNKDTVDKVLQHLMEHGHKVDGGDRLGKTIIFARNHEHAKFIEERFNHHYPHYKGHFARVIDNYAKYPQSLIDDFSQKEKAPHIAISVDMLDTGIDIPEVVNLVFFKPVYSKIKFWQMIGRGTRLCPGLYGPDADKQDFRVFDFCFNFEFFKENPEGLEADTAVPLGTRLFRARLQLLGHVQTSPALDEKGRVRKALVNELHQEVSAMNPNNFLVREHRKTIDVVRDRAAWNELRPAYVQRLQEEIAGLPTERKTDELESRVFDLTMLRMQLGLAEGKLEVVAKHRARVIEIAQLLEEKSAIPAVKAKLAYLADIQELAFWDGITLAVLEEIRVRLRTLVPFLDKKKRKIVFTDFQDEIVAVHEAVVVDMPKMTGMQYEKKVKSFLDNHRDHLVVHRLRTNQALTRTDLKGLETMLIEIGGDDGKTLLSSLLARSEAPSLAHFVRTLVGMDRAAAQAAFSAFLSDKSLTSPQIRFVEMVIDQLTARGVMEPSALYESPFSSLHAGGPEALFAGKGNVIDGIFKQLAAVHAALAKAG